MASALDFLRRKEPNRKSHPWTRETRERRRVLGVLSDSCPKAHVPKNHPTYPLADDPLI